MTEVLTAPAEVLTLTHTATRNSGILVETKYGNVNALHAVCERAGGGFDYYRYERGEQTWAGPIASAGSKGNAYGPTIYLGSNNKLDVLYREVAENRELPETRPTGTLMHTWSRPADERPLYPWTEHRWELPNAKDVSGAPAVARWGFGDSGTEVIAPLAGGGFRHWYRNGSGTWYSNVQMYPNHLSGVAMVLGPGKWLFVVALETDGRFWAIHRDGKENWHSRDLGRAYTGRPALVESGRGPNIAYDCVVANETGGLIHYGVVGWFEQTVEARFGDPNCVYSDIGLVYNYANQLEVVARNTKTGRLEHHVNRFDNKGWVAGQPFAAPNAKGTWNVQYDLEAIGIHTTLLRTNEVVTYGLGDHDEHHVRGSMLDLNSGTVTRLPHDIPHVFCSGQAQLPNGDLLIAGGHTNTEHKLHKLTRNGNAWQFAKLPDLHHGRWYPTVTTMPDGKVLILGGAYKAGGGSLNHSYEVFDPNNETDPRKRIDLWDEIGEKFCDDYDHIDMYPFVFALPNQRVFVHSRYTTRLFEYPKRGKAAWSNRIDATFKSPRTYGFQGTSVLLPLSANASNEYPGATVALFGGAGAKNGNIDTPATDTAELMVTDAASPSWARLANRMTTPRVMPDAVLLPDGTVLIVSGSRAGMGDGRNSRQPVLSAELYDPNTTKFTAVAPMRVPRLYHASAILLPDARVLVTGKCKFYNASPYDYPEHRGEVFTPPYLLTDDPRPGFVEAPTAITTKEQKLAIKVTGVAPSEIGKLMLIRLGSATHSFNMDQRAVSLPFTLSGETLTATAPKSNWVVPPGYYMLFAVSKAGVPSHARTVHVGILA